MCVQRSTTIVRKTHDVCHRLQLQRSAGCRWRVDTNLCALPILWRPVFLLRSLTKAKHMHESRWKVHENNSSAQWQLQWWNKRTATVFVWKSTKSCYTTFSHLTRTYGVMKISPITGCFEIHVVLIRNKTFTSITIFHKAVKFVYSALGTKFIS